MLTVVQPASRASSVKGATGMRRVRVMVPLARATLGARSRRRRVVPVVLAAAVLLVGPWPPVASARDGGPARSAGETFDGTVEHEGNEYRYLLHTPTTYDDDRAAPLVVVVHGCQTTAAEMQETARVDEVAEREGFVVLYPDVDAHGRAQEGPLRDCWRFADPATLTRGGSDTGAIVAMTRRAMEERTIDAERVYVVGVSAGGLMTAALAATHPDLYAAVGLLATAGFANASCFTGGEGIPTEDSAQQAFEAMGERARVVPLFVIGSTGDDAFPASCADRALEQGLRTSNLVIGGTQDAPIPLEPDTVEEVRPPGGHAHTTSTYRDPDGCLIAEKTIVEGMPHAWSGGATGRGDARGPSGAEIAWAFFRRYTMSSTAMPCAEAPEPRATPDPPSRESSTEPAADDTTDDGAPVVVIVAAAAVVLLAGGAVWLVGRRRRT